MAGIVINVCRRRIIRLHVIVVRDVVDCLHQCFSDIWISITGWDDVDVVGLRSLTAFFFYFVSAE